MALLSPQVVPITALTASYAAPTTSDTVAPDDGLVLHVKNTNAATRDVTVVVPGTTFGQANGDVVETVPATSGDVFIAIPNDPRLIDPATGLITVTFEATAGVTVALLKFSSA